METHLVFGFRLTFAYIVSLLATSVVLSSASIDYNLFNYNAETLETSSEAKAHIVLMYADNEQCKDCEAARALIHELMDKYNIAEHRKVTAVELDCSQNDDFCTKFEVTSNPQFYFFHIGERKNVKYIGDVNVKDLITFVMEQGDVEEPLESKNGLYVLTKDTFKSFVADGNHFIKFYAPWCGHCKKLAPTWDDLAKGFEQSQDVMISKVDCTAHQEICKEHGVRGYPTLKFFNSGIEVTSYSGERSHEALKRFVVEQVEKQNAPPPPVEPETAEEEAKPTVRELTDADFTDVTSSGNTFVKFYAPWCGHCKRLAPTWEELGKAVSDIGGVSIAKVDCTKFREVCSDNGVKGFPTLHLFKDGVRQEKYTSARDLESLKAYLMGEFKKDEL